MPTLEDAVLVVAHPDDEVLWFGSILPQVGRIVIAFRDYAAMPGLGERRSAAMTELPYAARLTCLGIPEAGSLKHADWTHPVPTEFGLALDEALEHSEVCQDYRRNFVTLRAALASMLCAGIDVFTHNPWGEYGHEDHVQVYRVVESLQGQLGFRLWTSSYCSSRAATLACRYRAADHPVMRLPVDRSYASGIAAIYQRHDCWTWANDWLWPAEDCFLSGPLGPAEGQGPDERLCFVASDL